ncbi:ATP-binding protein [Sphingomonas psychrotolerans]|nr:ATP-binding protein [Sphingomonas psychrotolerans]
MARLRVEVAHDEVPQMLRAIILTALANAPDVDIVDETQTNAGTPPVVDVLITGSGVDAGFALRSGRARRVIQIDAGGRAAELHWLENRVQRIEQLSIERLMGMLRDAPATLEHPRPPAAAKLRRRWLPGRRVTTVAMMAEDPLASPGDVAEPPPLVGLDGAPLEVTLDPITARLAVLVTRIAANRPSTSRQGDAFAALAQALGGGGAAHSAEPPGLTFIADRFGLSADERDLLFLAAVVEIDPRAARMVGLLNDHAGRSRPIAGVVADWGGDARTLLERLAGDGPLTRYALVSLEGEGPIATRTVVADASIWPLLFGLDRRPPYAVEALEGALPEKLEAPEAVQTEVARVITGLQGQEPATIFVAVVGDEEVGRGAIARTVAASLNRQAIAVAGAALQTAAAIAALGREAMIAEAAVIVTDPDAMPVERWRELVTGLDAPLFAVADPDRIKPLLLTTARPAITLAAPRRDWPQRIRMWRSRAPSDWQPEAIDDIADRFDFGNARIDAALGLATAEARAAGRAAPDAADARIACERVRDTRFGSAAERLELQFEVNDIVLRDETRRELDLAIAWAQHGARLFGEGGPAASLHAGAGLACLFTGPPGTGKTMAAQIVARQVDYALYRVDLSQVVDKYIGEGEKRISSLFKEAGRSRVALFFDEADALFGKRTEVRDSHDRYANIAVDHMLQEIERFPGWTILATNLSGNIDNAFMRRIRVRADFPAPGPADRCAIWNRLLPPPGERGDILVQPLAEPYELVGGEIRNAVYTAHLLAASEGTELAMRHCVAGLARELGKSGRVADLGVLAPWLPEGAAGRARIIRAVPD